MPRNRIEAHLVGFSFVLGLLALLDGPSAASVLAPTSADLGTPLAPPPGSAVAGAAVVVPSQMESGEIAWVGGRALGARVRDARGTERSFEGLGRPLGAALGHLDRDGSLDLAVSHASGALVIYRGNAAFTASAAEQEAWRAQGFAEPTAFLAEAEVIDLPSAGELVATGDFDADGDEDIVVGAVGSRELLLSTHDGQGGFAVAETVLLPGPATAWAAGDVNRRDGLADLVIGVVTGSGPALAVYESPEGALRGTPEMIVLPAAAVSIALGPMDERGRVSIVAAAGRDVVIVNGRDRRLGRVPREPVAAAAVERIALPAEALSVAIGQFARDAARPEIVALTVEGELWQIGAEADGAGPSARRVGETTGSRLVALPFSGKAVSDLLVASERALSVLSSASGEGFVRRGTLGLTSPAVVLAARLDADALDDLVVVAERACGPAVAVRAVTATYTVNDAGDASDAAINSVCETAAGNGVCTLRAAIQEANAHPGSLIKVSTVVGFVAINPSPDLPQILGPVTVNGNQCAGFICHTTRLRATASGHNLGINFGGAGATLGSFEIGGYNLAAVQLTGTGGHVVKGCVIGGVGTGNRNGIRILSADNTIGGTAAADRNTIYGNLGLGDGASGYGIYSVDSTNSGNTILGNYLGTPTGSAPAYPNDIGLSMHGINTLGTAAAGNLISGNASYGIRLGDGSLVQNNTIGTDAAGVEVLPNGAGILIRDANDATIGGTAAGLGNLISGNSGAGIELRSTGARVTRDNIIQGNLVGTRRNGTQARANARGIDIATSYNQVGGTVAGARNVISANTQSGVILSGWENSVVGNYIGTDLTGSAALPNSIGVQVNGISGAEGNLIGTAVAGGGNVISGNSIGVYLTDATLTKVQNNWIGVAADGTTPLGNSAPGVSSDRTSERNLIGGTGAGEGNLIAHNRGGVYLAGSGSLNRVSGNHLVDNYDAASYQLGINLRAAGENSFGVVTPNDPLDADSGPNGLQNFPVLMSAETSGSQLVVVGTLDSEAGKSYSIELFANAGCSLLGNGEAETYLGSVPVTTDGAGHAAFSSTLPVAVAVGAAITANASLLGTGTEASTSELSPCRTTTQQSPEIFQDGFETGSFSNWSQAQNRVQDPLVNAR